MTSRNQLAPAELDRLPSRQARRLRPQALLAAVVMHTVVILLSLRSCEVAVPQAPVTIAIMIVPEPSALTEGEAAPAAEATDAQAAQEAVTPAMVDEPPVPPQTMPDADPAPAAVVPPIVVPDETPPAVEASAPPVANEPAVQAVPEPVVRAEAKPVPQKPRSRTRPAARLSRQPAAPSHAEPAASRAASVSADAASASAAARAASSASSWESQIGAWLQAHKHYPELARNRGEEGIVSLSFVVARDGHVLDVSLARSSGFAALDNAAVTMLRDAQVPALPASMPQPRLAVTVALRYSLAR